jgi:putative FmdB family regulatory protein
MPIYEYECVDCGKKFEIFQKMSEEPLKECKVCKGRLNRLISLCSFQLKGTGWYVTDYKSPAGKDNGAKQADKHEGKAEEKAETRPETKPETKPETAKSEATGGAA